MFGIDEEICNKNKSMSLFIDLPDDLVLNYVLLFIGNVNEILMLRSVSKSFNDKVEILLLAIIELDLTTLELIKSDKNFNEHKTVLEDFEDIKKMQIFRLKSLSLPKAIDDFDFFVGQGLTSLCRNSLLDYSWEELEDFFHHTMAQELREVFKLECSVEVYERANLMCLNALSVPIEVSDKQRKVLNWLTGALKMLQIFFSLQPNFAALQELKAKYEFHTKRVNQISQYFGMFQQIN